MNHWALTWILFVALAVGSACKKDQPFLVNNDPDADGPPAGQDGSGCSSDGRCDGETCFMFGDGWSGGYCTTLDCEPGSCNGDDAECIRFLDGSSFCLDGCQSNADCRSGYRCRALDATGRAVCYRDEGEGPLAGSIGSDCGTDVDCHGSLVCDPGPPGGYCLKPNCGGGCPEESVCANWNGDDKCVDACEATTECRTGYICNEGVCTAGDPVVPPFDFSVTEDVLGIHCGGEDMGVDGFGTRWRMTYDVPASAAGYVLVPFVHTGTLRPMEIGLPSGGTIDLVNDYRHHNIRITEFQFFDQEADGTYGEVALDWPILVPYSPERADLLEAGKHTVDVVASVGEPCLYVLPSDGTGVKIDINVIFMGLQGYSAAMAPGDADLAAVFSRMDEILGQAGLSVGDVKYYDAPRELAERYAFVRDEADLKRATAFGAPRGESLDGHLNVDMFLVEDLQAGGGVELLGLSAGLPGPPGLHGNAANGLVFTGADIGVANEFVAHIMAHELGHYVGLRHTTEVLHNDPRGVELEAVLGTEDPIEDTPVCNSVIAQQGTCPDAMNLMFPSASGASFTPTLTDGQGQVLKGNPLFKP